MRGCAPRASSALFTPPGVLNGAFLRLRAADFQDESTAARKKQRSQYSKFFYRFPDGESGADVYDRMTVFEDHIVRDIDAGRFTEDTAIVIITHGLSLRVFLMRWNHWSVADYEECVLRAAACSVARPPRRTSVLVAG